MKKAIYSFWALLILALTSCDQAYPPVIVNASNSSITIRVKYVGEHTPFSGTVPKGSEFFHRQPNLKIAEISFESGSGNKHLYTASQLNELRSTAQDKTAPEIWVLSETGLESVMHFLGRKN